MHPDDLAQHRREFGEPSDLGYGLGGHGFDSGFRGDVPDVSGMRPTDTSPAPREQWKGRRRMAWIALISTIAVTALAIFYIPTERLDVLTDIIMWFFVTMGSIIGAYMGFTAWWARSTKDRR